MRCATDCLQRATSCFSSSSSRDVFTCGKEINAINTPGSTYDRPAPASPSSPVLAPHGQQQDQDDGDHYQQLLQQELDALPSAAYVEQLQGSAVLSPVRTALVDWMADTALALQLTTDSLFLAAQLLDRHLSATSTQAKELLYVSAVIALWVAAKYEEGQAPTASAFGQVASSIGVTTAALQAGELPFLASVDHRLSLPTVKTFLRRYLGRLQVSPELYFSAGYLAELCLLDGSMLQLRPSAVAASAYVWALVLNGHYCDDAHLRAVTGYGLADLLPAVLRLAKLHHAASSTSEPCMISCKYLGQSVGRVAALRPLAPEHAAHVMAAMVGAKQA